MRKTYWRFLSIVAAILSLVATACAPAPAATEATSPVTTPAATPLPDEVQEAVDAVRQDLAEQLDMSADQIQVVSTEPVDWPDTSLGCPQPGQSYAQVIAPGYRILLEAGGERYEYHTGGSNWVLCEESQAETGEATNLPPEVQALVEKAKQDLGDRLGVLEGQIEVISVEGVEWRDTSLGCPKPGLSYAQVITPGYRIQLRVDGQIYEYHTDTQNVVYCK